MLQDVTRCVSTTDRNHHLLFVTICQELLENMHNKDNRNTLIQIMSLEIKVLNIFLVCQKVLTC